MTERKLEKTLNTRLLAVAGALALAAGCLYETEPLGDDDDSAEFIPRTRIIEVQVGDWDCDVELPGAVVTEPAPTITIIPPDTGFDIPPEGDAVWVDGNNSATFDLNGANTHDTFYTGLGFAPLDTVMTDCDNPDLQTSFYMDGFFAQ